MNSGEVVEARIRRIEVAVICNMPQIDVNVNINVNEQFLLRCMEYRRGLAMKMLSVRLSNA